MTKLNSLNILEGVVEILHTSIMSDMVLNCFHDGLNVFEVCKEDSWIVDVVHSMSVEYLLFQMSHREVAFFVIHSVRCSLLLIRRLLLPKQQ